ncbi:MAG: TenA family protein [Candidatus Puniceispirillales bacterium]
MHENKKYSKIFNILKSNNLTNWNNYTKHKFVKNIANGTLKKELYIKYLIQDYLFLIHFSKAWALLVLKSNSTEEMRVSSATLHALINEELQLHINTCKEYGISESQLYNAEEEIANIAYTRYVLENGYTGDFLNLLISLIPCVFGYGEIGLELSNVANKNNPYIKWINTYGSNEYQALCIKIGNMLDIAIINRLGNNFENNLKWNILNNQFITATKLEINFWEMSLHLK